MEGLHAAAVILGMMHTTFTSREEDFQPQTLLQLC